MDGTKFEHFNVKEYLSQPGLGRRILHFKSKQSFFSQGSPADAVFFLQSGRAKLTVVSKRGKEATVSLLAPGDFVGEEAITGTDVMRRATATAVTACVTTRLERSEFRRALAGEHALSDFFLKFMVVRGMRTQADLIDQLFNSSERRLARTLLLMADFGKPGEPEQFIPPITQETLAEMIGTTRSRVSYFMNRFRKLGYISYKGRIQVHKSLLNMVLQDNLPEQNATRPVLLDPPQTPKRKAIRANQLQ